MQAAAERWHLHRGQAGAVLGALGAQSSSGLRAEQSVFPPLFAGLIEIGSWRLDTT